MATRVESVAGEDEAVEERRALLLPDLAILDRR